MAELILMTSALGASTEILPGLGFLSHQVHIVRPDIHELLLGRRGDIVLVDARRDLAGARALCRLLATTGTSCPVIVVLTEGGLVAVAHDWTFTDILLDSAGPAEIDARIRLALTRAPQDDPDLNSPITNGNLEIDESTYAARLDGRLLDLTYKEFELLKYLVQHPGRVFTRTQLLQEVWGYDYFGGTRTVDVHIRRLRAKLGTDNENLIGTVRNVGYRFVPDEVPA
ncbi:DNA-binding response regulator, OmpR family, contains REC and winged-helix (wHTH) domain [Austwickia chelonae]|uniref:Putative transcriptional regulator n=1 Tax=Austwickia chelonae NBRC 105200 TaxID=1184607 RepID=K6VR12_9MICO|nr:response regulator transcription factor [Austwickia chelonae]GAB77810.1 putative transcriptional regulator [Austwickia chelonae NBRC 105200]SEV89950.1 DNA-binding response regulator, OmpR family, contains REC and winged-helix (wHTH) domain [Austwickia chelonae]